VAHDAAGGVGRRAARSGATLFRDATLTAGFGLPARLSAAPTLKHLDQEEGPADGGDHSEAEEPRRCHSADANLVSKRVNARWKATSSVHPSPYPKTGSTGRETELASRRRSLMRCPPLPTAAW
jgi:hypothetical protein